MTDRCPTCDGELSDEVQFTSTVIPEGNRNGLSGQHNVIATLHGVSDFAIAPNEEAAKAKALQRVHYRLDIEGKS